MSVWDYFRSVVILIATVYIVDLTFEAVTVFEAFLLVVLLAVCVFHTMDLRDEIVKKIEKNRAKKEQRKDGTS